MITVSYCLSNVDAETRRWLRQCEFSVVEDHCLQRCGDCLLGPFLLVGNTMVQGESHEMIMARLHAEMCKEEEQTA